MINYNLSLQCFDTVGWQKKGHKAHTAEPTIITNTTYCRQL